MRRLVVAAALSVLSVTAGAQPQPYPSRPINVIVPFPAGGPVDTLARFLAERMRPLLGQSVIVENVSGAAGSIGVGRVARAPADGYTLVDGIWSTHVVNAAIYPLHYDVFNDFDPVALLTNSSQLIVGKRTLPPENLRGLIDWLKANPDKATAGTAGIGSPQHVFGILFQNSAGVHFQFAHYRGGAPATQDLVAGQIELVIADQVTTLPQIRAGTIKAYAFTGRNRLPAAPDVPTADEAGLAGFHTSVWNAIWVPRGTPKDVVAKLNTVIVDALADENVRRRLAELGHQVVPREEQAPEKLRAFHKAEIDKWWPVIKAAGIKAQ